MVTKLFRVELIEEKTTTTLVEVRAHDRDEAEERAMSGHYVVIEEEILISPISINYADKYEEEDRFETI